MQIFSDDMSGRRETHSRKKQKYRLTKDALQRLYIGDTRQMTMVRVQSMIDTK